MSSFTDKARASYHAGLIAEGLNGIKEYAAQGLLPPQILEGLRMYLAERVETGGFLRHCLENDFQGAVSRAHPSLTLGQIKALNALIFTCFPSMCCGSPSAVREWLDGWERATGEGDENGDG